MNAVEAEIIEVSGRTPRKKYKTREEYLTWLLKQLYELPKDKFDYLISNQTYAWYNRAAAAFKDKHPVPDLPEVSVEDLKHPRDEEDYEPPAIHVPTSEEHKQNIQALIDAHEEADKALDKLQKATDKVKPKRHSKYRLADPSEGARHYLYPEEDRFGLLRGSKRSQAAEMFERGATMKEVKERLGQTQYNLIAKLREDGHRIVNKGGIIKLTHKIDIDTVEGKELQ